MFNQEDLSIFGATGEGVPNPRVGHVHPYPTRFHGPIWTQPQAGYPYRPATYVEAPFNGIGEAAPPMTANEFVSAYVGSPMFWVSTIAGAVSAYHGYKRNNSVGWAVGWYLFGSMLPFIAVPVALAEGFGKPKSMKKNGRRRRHRRTR